MDKYDKNVPNEYDGLFQKAADANGVSYDLLRKVGWTESRFKPDAKSKTGPLGMMQFTKATAKAMGLRVTGGTDDERLNPELAINAAAKHLGQLVQKFDGDELKAALAYNQGEGRLGVPQLEAYARGDFAKISEEGRNYIRNLADVARSPMTAKLEEFGGITPKAKGIPADVAFKGIEKKGSVGDTLPESTGMNLVGKEQEAKAKPFAKDFWEKRGETISEYEDRGIWSGFGESVKSEVHNSVLGMAVRSAASGAGMDVFMDSITPTRWNSHVFSEEELAKIRKEVKNPAYINVVTGGSPENLDELIKLANENYEADVKSANSGVAAKLTAGVLGAAIDPTSWIPVAGTAGKGFKMVKKALVVGAESAGMAALSEGLRTSYVGGEADYQNAMLGGFVFGSGMSALSDAVGTALRKRGVSDDEIPRNEFLGPLARMEARETALNANSLDLSRMQTESLQFQEGVHGVKFADHPVEAGAVVLEDGSILSAGNPLNPKAFKEFQQLEEKVTPKARAGVKLRGFTEIGQTILRSDNEAIRKLGSDLVRSPLGMEDMSGGKFGATASDIHERIHYVDQRTYHQLDGLMKEALKDPEFSVGVYKMSKEAAQQEIFKRVALAIERPELQVNLTKSEANILKVVKEHFDSKRELMENPAMFGNSKAVSIFPDSRHKGTYVPNVYDTTAKNLSIQRMGSAEALQEAIADSWIVSYQARPEVKTRVDETLKEVHGVEEVTQDMVRKYAMDKAYGISHSDQFQISSVLEENLGSGNVGLEGIENNSFLEARSLFDSDLPITLPDGTTFAVNDLRSFDMFKLIPSYDRRINGDIAIMGGTGKTTKELKDEINALRHRAKGNGKEEAEANALGDVVKMLTGRARRDADSELEIMARSLSDLSFATKNAYMGLMNLSEVASMVAKGNLRGVMANIPYVREMAYRRHPLNPDELREISSSFFGREIDQTLRPSRADITQRIRETTSSQGLTANILGTVKYGTQEIAARSPFTKFLNATSNAILDTARQGFLGNIVEASLMGKKSKWGAEQFLKAASVTPEQWEGIQKLVRDHMELGADGKYHMKDQKAFAADPRSMDLWRLSDRMADETILRPHKVSLQDTKAYNAFVKLAAQFKAFSIKSLNSRLVRSYYDATKNNRALDTALALAVSSGLGLGMTVLTSQLKAYGLPENERKEYLEGVMNPTMLTYASVARSSHLGSAFALSDMVGAMFGYSTMKDLKTSIVPRPEVEKDTSKVPTPKTMADTIMGNLGQQIPALGFVGAVGATGVGINKYLTADTSAQRQESLTGLWGAMRNLVPNDPITQQLLLNIYESQGIDVRK